MEVFWKALADPTRRAILEKLRSGPLTAGHLAEHFPNITRFAVRKHLQVLQEARLVIVEPRGRERWIHLNAMPIQETLKHWLAGYRGVWAERLRNLQDLAEGPKINEVNDMPTATASAAELRTFDIATELTIGAPVERVWKAFVENINAWWGPGGRSTAESPKRMVLEARLGGVLREDWGEGKGMILAHVAVLDAPNRLDLHGSFWLGGGVQSNAQFFLKEEGGKTVLRLRHRACGMMDENTSSQYQGGWTEILDKLRKLVETE